MNHWSSKVLFPVSSFQDSAPSAPRDWLLAPRYEAALIRTCRDWRWYRYATTLIRTCRDWWFRIPRVGPSPELRKAPVHACDFISSGRIVGLFGCGSNCCSLGLAKIYNSVVHTAQVRGSSADSYQDVRRPPLPRPTELLSFIRGAVA